MDDWIHTASCVFEDFLQSQDFAIPMIYFGAYFLFYLGVAVWILFDSSKRNFFGLPWAIATFLLGPFVAPVYLSKRTLKTGETRSGGLAWNLAKYFALFWTATVAVIFLADNIDASTSITIRDNTDKAATAIAFFVVVVLYFVIWLIPVAVALTTGFLLKKSSVVEEGPIAVGGEGSMTSARTGSSVKAPPPASRSSQRNLPAEIYLTRDGQQYGPYSPEQLKAGMKDGTVSSNDFAWYEGVEEWVAARVLTLNPCHIVEKAILELSHGETAYTYI